MSKIFSDDKFQNSVKTPQTRSVDSSKAPLISTTPSTRPTPLLSPSLKFPFPEEFETLAANARRGCVRNYYHSQADLLKKYNEDELLIKEFMDSCVRPAKRSATSPEPSSPIATSVQKQRICDQIISYVTLVLNGFLLVIKCVAAILSGSLAIISSVIDSAVDMTSGIVLSLTTRAIRHRDPYLYPRGRTRLDPLASIVVSVIMGVASFFVISKSIENIVTNNIHVEVGYLTIGIMVFTVAMKLSLFIVCRCFRSPSTDILAQDHRNDCISNTLAITCAYLSDKFPDAKVLDPICAILVSVYIIVLSLIIGLLLIPGSFGTPMLQSFCGPDAFPYHLGHCGIGWSFGMAIVGTFMALFCPYLSFNTNFQSFRVSPLEIRLPSKNGDYQPLSDGKEYFI